MRGLIAFGLLAYGSIGAVAYADTINRPACYERESISIEGRFAVYRYCDGSLLRDSDPEFVRYTY